MDQTPSSMAELIERIAAWASARPDIQTVLIVGSQARADRPADPWSDLDLVLIATDPERYLDEADWVLEIGRPWITFVEGNNVGGRERRVLFEGGLDVDFNFFGPEQFQQVMRDRAAIRTLHRGFRVLLDREERFAALAGPPDEPPAARMPEEGEFLNHVNDFWYHAVWSAKKLRRGELYTAKGCLDSYMKRQIREMAEAHARATHGPGYDTWHEGRFLEKWADPRVVEGLHTAYASYDAADLSRALRVTMDLYRWLAIETAERLGFPYPAGADERATAWVRNCLAEGPP